MKSRLLQSIFGAALLAVACAQTDAGVTTSIKTQLAADETVKARQIDVDTKNHIVTLKGEVRTTEEEARALQIARDTKGVTDVVDQITVTPEVAPTTGEKSFDPEPPAITLDAGLTSAVKTRLLADPETAGLRVDVETRNGVVTLTGAVRTKSEKDEALRIARETEGVASVTDRLTVEGRR